MLSRIQRGGPTLAAYDGTNCDDLCLLEEIAMELNLETPGEPIPLHEI